jgi:hypothetical protein
MEEGWWEEGGKRKGGRLAAAFETRERVSKEAGTYRRRRR